MSVLDWLFGGRKTKKRKTSRPRTTKKRAVKKTGLKKFVFFDKYTDKVLGVIESKTAPQASKAFWNSNPGLSDEGIRSMTKARWDREQSQ